MRFAELVDAVITETNRADLGLVANGGSGLIPQKVQEATLALHSMSAWMKDLCSAQVDFPTATYIQALDTSIFPRFRAPAAIRKWDVSFNDQFGEPNSSASSFLDIRDLTSMFNKYGEELLDVAYISGNTVNMRSSTPLKTILFFYLQRPNIDPANFKSWIAEEYPYAIITRAASIIFMSIGKQEASRSYDNPATGIVPFWDKILKNEKKVEWLT